MRLSENEIIQKYCQKCRHCNRNTLRLYDYEWTCILCIHNITKRKHELTKVQRKKKVSSIY